MDHTIKAHDLTYKEKNGVVKRFLNDYVLSAIFWLPHKYSDYRRINQIQKELVTLESEVFHYKLHWGFSKNSPLDLRASGASEMAPPSENFLALDDLSEAIRSLLFQLNSYSLLEKLMHFDVAKHEQLVQEHRRDFSRIIALAE